MEVRTSLNPNLPRNGIGGNENLKRGMDQKIPLMGSAVKRKRLSDITNTVSSSRVAISDAQFQEKPKEVACGITKECIGQLMETPPRAVPSSSSSSSSLSKVIYSDRFIPSRIGSNFDLFDLAATSPSNSSVGGGKEEGSSTYSTLLRSVLFGPDHVAPPATPDRSVSFGGRGGSLSSSPSSSLSPFSTPSRNIFRFKAEVPRYSSSPVGFEDALPGVVHSQPKAPRKVPRSPYKVLDAPALQDDFYLNLVEWSSHNVLAVGLGNCVYLWNACSSKENATLLRAIPLCD